MAGDAPVRSRALRRFFAGGVEAVWLALLILLALSFSPYTESNFALPKAVWLRLLVPLAIVAFAASATARAKLRAGVSATVTATGVWIAIGLFVVISLLSNLAAANPMVSFWGTELRGGGTLTLLCQVALAALVATRLQREQQWRRLVFATLLAGSLTAVFALVQGLGADPFEYSLRYDGQASSTMAHPSALGAYLIFPAFLAFEQFLEAISSGKRRLPWSAVVSVASLGVILWALYLTRGRASLLALAGGCLIWWLLATLDPRPDLDTAGRSPGKLLMRPAVPVVVLLVLAGIATSVLVLAPLPGLRLAVDRPAAAMDASVIRRLLMWETAADALWEGPLSEPDDSIPAMFRFGTPTRWAIGYGPGAAGVVLAGHYSEARTQQLARAPDSTHSLVFDVLLTLGVLGLGAALWLTCSVVGFVSRALGLAESRGQIDLLVAMLVCGAAMGFVAPIALTRAHGYGGTGLLTLSGPGLAIGVLAGWIVFLALRAFALRRAPANRPAPHSRVVRLRLRALMAALVGHYVLLQIGIAGIAANSYAFLFLGAILALGGRGLVEAPDRRADRPLVAGCLTLLAALALAVALSGAPSGLDPVPTLSLESWAGRVDRGGMALAVTASVAVGALLARLLSAVTQHRPSTPVGSRPQHRVRLAWGAAAAIMLLLPVPAMSEWVHRIPATDAANLLAGIVLLGRVVAVEVVVLVGLLAWFCAPARSRQARSTTGAGRALAAGTAVAMLAVLIAANPMAWWESDVGIRRGKAHLALGQYEPGLEMHEWAIGRWPFGANGWSATGKARTRTAIERRGSEHVEADVARAFETLQRAVEMEPWSALKRADLARISVLAAVMEPEPLRRRRHLERADELLRIARYLQPWSARIRTDLLSVRTELAGSPTRD